MQHLPSGEAPRWQRSGQSGIGTENPIGEIRASESMGKHQREIYNSVLGVRSQEIQGIRVNEHIYALTGATDCFQTGTAWDTHEKHRENKAIEIKRWEITI